MEKKQIGFKTKGMNRDLSVSAFNPEFSFENMNLRLSTNEGNTMLSWVNERGPKELTISVDNYPWRPTEGAQPRDRYESFLRGTPIGQAIINKKLVLFTTGKEMEDTGEERPVYHNYDYIYVLTYTGEDAQHNLCMEGTRLFKGQLNFSTDNPLETIVSYEATTIQKVYWVDGRNQPRVLNIEAKDSIVEKWNNSPDVLSTYFNFVPNLEFGETVTIDHNTESGGTFAPGVIQYCLTYIDNMGQQSNIFYISPLYYITHSDRGASPEEMVANSFKIQVSWANTAPFFKYVRFYSIQRTSLNSNVVKLLGDVSISDSTVVSFTDTGSEGAQIDPYELLYVGGKEIIAYTMADKDNTLFLGNIKESTPSVVGIQDWFTQYREAREAGQSGHDAFISFGRGIAGGKRLVLGSVGSYYGHTNTLKYSHRDITTFKGGESYRFGFQLQTQTGEWTEPIFIEDAENALYPQTSINSSNIDLVYAQATLDFSNISAFDATKFKRIRPVVVYPSVNERNVLYQGVLNPTMFNVEDRENNTPFAQPSWFFRPYVNEREHTNPTAIPNTVAVQNVATQEDYDDINNEGLEAPENNVYVLIAKMSNGALDEFRSTTRIAGVYYTKKTVTKVMIDNQILSQTSIEDGEQPLKGIIVLSSAVESGVTYHTCAFVSNTPWPQNYGQEEDEPQEEGDETTWIHITWLKSLSNVNVLTETFRLSSCVGSTRNTFFYEQPVGTAITEYNFKFKTAQNFYNAVISSEEGYEIETEKNGSILPYKHYDSLWSYDALYSQYYFSTGLGIMNVVPYVDPEKTKDYAVEIQGSTAKYSNPYSTTSLSDSNTQFFIDHSIVTLNSPDIEFDTQVQNLNLSSVKMRIVGAIPITATASSHKIDLSTAKVPTMYLWNESEDESITSMYTSLQSLQKYGDGELDIDVFHKNLSIEGGRRLVSEFFWDDAVVWNSTGVFWDARNYGSKARTNRFFVCPWQAQGSLNNDPRGLSEGAFSWLKQKRHGNMSFSANTEYFQAKGMNVGNTQDPISYYEFQDAALQTYLTDSGVTMLRFDKQAGSLSSDAYSYFPTIEKVLYNSTGFIPGIYSPGLSVSNNIDQVINPLGSWTENQVAYVRYMYPHNCVVPITYKSTSHAIITFKAGVGANIIPILPYGYYNTTDVSVGEYVSPVGELESHQTFWGDEMYFVQNKINNMQSLFDGLAYDYLWLGEVIQDVQNKFGGTTKDALLANNWTIGGKDMDIPASGEVALQWTEGDTYYQRYDCLKTLENTPEDQNVIREYLSFMCETRVNIDGRYDRNRLYTDNNMLIVKAENFNQLNPVYNQEDNYFIQKKTSIEDITEQQYPNTIYYSKTKTLGDEVDNYTNITMTSVLDLDGDKGEITAIRRLKDQLIAFQDTGISQILYNENVQIASQENVPIEIANSGKVQGKRYLSDTVGCSNKWSIVTSPMGLYFIDSNNRDIYLFNGQLNNVSTAKGMNSWIKQKDITDKIWNPADFNSFVAYYDRLNQEVMFIDSTTALAFSEKVESFTSFYDYNNAPYFCNFSGVGLWAKAAKVSGEDLTKLYQHQAGEYCNFFGTKKPYWMTLVGNPEPTLDKIFTNLEFRACVRNQQIESGTVQLPFDKLEVWNEYQRGTAILTQHNGYTRYKHHTSDGMADLVRKFRIWRCDVPRDNHTGSLHPRDRIRNTWAYMKLRKNAATTGNLPKVEIHDMVMTYYK